MYSTPSFTYPVKGITLVSVSYLLERLSYYGCRSVLVLYMVNNLQLSKGDAVWIYALATGLSYLFVLLGGLLGDILLRPARAIILGGVLEAIGCFCIAVPDRTVVIGGMLLIGMGTGLFKPNVLSQVAALYQGHKRYLDAGFSIVYFAINIGSFLAPIIIGGIADTDTLIRPIGFVIAGCVALLSVIPWIADYKSMNETFALKARQQAPVSTQGILSMLAVFFLYPAFWAVYEIVSSMSYACGSSSVQLVFALATVALTPIAAIAWSLIKFDSLYKLALGFILLIIPVVLAGFGSPCISAMPIFTGLPEIMVAIPVLSVIARFAPVRWTGLFFSISIAMGYFSKELLSLLDPFMASHQEMATTLLIMFCVIVAGLFFLLGITFRPADQQAS